MLHIVREPQHGSPFSWYLEAGGKEPKMIRAILRLLTVSSRKPTRLATLTSHGCPLVEEA